MLITIIIIPLLSFLCGGLMGRYLGHDWVKAITTLFNGIKYV